MNKTLIASACCAAAALAAAPALARGLGEAWWAPVAPDGVQRVRIRCGPNFIDPRVIVVKAGIPVELLVSAAPGTAAQRLSVSNPQGAALAAGDAGSAPQAVPFTPDATGDFPLACQDSTGVPDPTQQKGKQGILTVIP